MNSYELQNKHDQLLSQLANEEQKFKEATAANASQQELKAIDEQIKLLENTLTNLRIEMYYL